MQLTYIKRAAAAIAVGGCGVGLVGGQALDPPADLQTLSGYAFRYTAATLVPGGPADTFSSAVGWTDDRDGSPLRGNPLLPGLTRRRGRAQVATLRANLGGVLTIPFKQGVGVPLGTRNCGVVVVGQWSAGGNNQTRPVAALGSETEFLVIGNDPLGRVRLSGVGQADPVDFPTLRLPCGPTCLLVQSWHAGTWVKVFGLPGVHGGPVGSDVVGRSVLLFMDPDSGADKRFLGAVDEVAFFDEARVEQHAAEIEADVARRYGLVAPARGHVVCVGTSLGVGDYAGLSNVSWPADVGAALPGWFTVNNSREGQTIAGAHAARATLFDAPWDRPLGSDRPTVFIIELGANDILQGGTGAGMAGRMRALVSDLRADYPSAEIAVATVVALGSRGVQERARAEYNGWLVSGGLADLAVRVIDAADADASLRPAGESDEAVQAVTGNENFRTYDLAGELTGGDRVHWSLVGADRILPVFVAGARASAAAACARAGGGVCCEADFDRSGSVGVNDVLAFLGAYFAGSAAADVDESGGLGVQDVFEFLRAYFAGCG